MLALVVFTTFSMNTFATSAYVQWESFEKSDNSKYIPGKVTGKINFRQNENLPFETTDVTYTGEVFYAQTSSQGLTKDYFRPTGPFVNEISDTRPPALNIIILNGSGSFTNTLTFSRPITTFLSILSLGDINWDSASRFEFDQPFEIVDQGRGYFGGTDTSLWQEGNTLFGYEGNGTIFFDEPVTSISWTSPTKYEFQAFTVGEYQPTLISPVPEPETWAMLFAGLTCVSWWTRRKITSENK